MASSIWTRAELDEQITLYKRALKACASGASYTIGSRSLTRQDLPRIREHLAYLAGELAALDHGRGPVLVQARVPHHKRGRR
ncbi:hypothetical protein [Desulfovibrio sp. ZJ200]|uniref:hypothetical protein n=1 Tax=Desulfovibrio sp. ZJ200 TaxID=2709792 RepID=UPI0013EA8C66|nr:hypothetical protein [Desulfovibrio sp. ZJ200]